ncbi:hypothetical protein G7077_12255 [Sphingomonas piscis]|uniref:Alginate export domain-containing protein n=1 Tax=Sphingomonas piscis TaxID=2714943 RepID=A0A6G7YS55_9SPHN|nr:hypothetical protein [Sphingomonas piscis]QIK79564.1 hypothetical protein G7077_12255 [Sphingomonas piscis]
MNRVSVALLASLVAGTAQAQVSDPTDREDRRDRAIGADVSYSTDADETEVLKAGVNLDIRSVGPEDYVGFRIEKVRFNPVGAGWQGDNRVYVRASSSQGEWKGAAQVGTDGHNVIGSASLHDEAAVRKEFFIERDILETRQGLSRGLYYTILGAAVDIPADDRNIFTVLGAVQTFTGENVRRHLRLNYVHVLDPGLGLTAQVRTRYFRNSDPGNMITIRLNGTRRCCRSYSSVGLIVAGCIWLRAATACRRTMPPTGAGQPTSMLE